MDASDTPGAHNPKHPKREGYRLKRVSLILRSRKAPNQSFTAYALLHEFNPRILSFFSAHKFPIDEEVEIELDYLGTTAKMKVVMLNIHEQISSGRVMNTVPDEQNPFPIRKFYRCFAGIRELEGSLPSPQPEKPLAVPGDAAAETPAASAPQVSVEPEATPPAEATAAEPAAA